MALLWLGLASSACGIFGPEDAVVRTWEVAPQKGACFGLFATLCLLVREPGAAEFTNLYDTPEGFDYEWGMAYVIDVAEYHLDVHVPDASSIRRVLRRVRSRTPVAPGSLFDLTLTGGEGIRSLGAGRYTLFAGPQELACVASTGCAELETLVAEQRTVRVTLAHPEDHGKPFTVSAWIACPEVGGPC